MIEINKNEILLDILTFLDNRVPHESCNQIKQAFYYYLGSCTIYKSVKELPVEQLGNKEILNLFIMAKKVKNCTNDTLKSYFKEMSLFFEWIQKPCKNIRQEDIEKYIAYSMLIRKNKESTINNKIRYLKSFFKWALLTEKIEKDPALPVESLKEEYRIKETFTDEQVELIRCACQNERDLAIIDVLFSTAMRISELTKLNRNDIDFINKECIVYGKGRKERPVFFTGKAVVHLKRYLKSRTDENEALFVLLKQPYSRLTRGGVQAMMRQLEKTIGNIHINPHKLRRTTATSMYNKGARAEDIQVILGHASSQTTTKHYCNVSKKIVREAHDKYSL